MELSKRQRVALDVQLARLGDGVKWETASFAQRQDGRFQVNQIFAAFFIPFETFLRLHLPTSIGLALIHPDKAT